MWVLGANTGLCTFQYCQEQFLQEINLIVTPAKRAVLIFLYLLVIATFSLYNFRETFLWPFIEDEVLYFNVIFSRELFLTENALNIFQFQAGS